METCNAVSNRTRIPIPALRILVEDGYLPEAGEEYAPLINSKRPVFFTESVDKFITEAVRRNSHALFEGEALGSYLSFSAFHGRGWSDALECVIDGRVRYIVDDHSRKRLSYRILIEAGQMDTFLEQAAAERPDAVPVGLSACVLKIEARTVCELTARYASAALQAPEGHLTHQQMLNVRKKFGTISQLAQELELKRRPVVDPLKAAGLQPILPVDSNFQPVYCREDAVRAIARRRCSQRRLPF